MCSIFANLETRVTLLEEAMRRQHDMLGRADTDNYNSNTRQDGGSIDEAAPPSGAVVVSVTNNSEQEERQTDSTTDGMALSFVDEQDCAFFGKRKDSHVNAARMF